MKDFLKKYHNRKVIGNIYMVIGALVLAFGVNFLLIDGTNFENNLKTSIIESVSTETKADVFLEKKGEKVVLKNSKSMQNTKNISFSIFYDNSSIEIGEINSKFGVTNILGEKGSGVETIILELENKTFSPNENLVEINFKKIKEGPTQINLVNTNFTDSQKNIFDLTTSGISI